MSLLRVVHLQPVAVPTYDTYDSTNDDPYNCTNDDTYDSTNDDTYDSTNDDTYDSTNDDTYDSTVPLYPRTAHTSCCAGMCVMQ